MTVIQTIYNKLEIGSFVGGSLWGLLSTTAAEIATKVIIALLTGAAATIGTHIAKCIINKLNNNGKRKE